LTVYFILLFCCLFSQWIIFWKSFIKDIQNFHHFHKNLGWEKTNCWTLNKTPNKVGYVSVRKDVNNIQKKLWKGRIKKLIAFYVKKTPSILIQKLFGNDNLIFPNPDFHSVLVCFLRKTKTLRKLFRKWMTISFSKNY
jgi:hypothetical protein